MVFSDTKIYFFAALLYSTNSGWWSGHRLRQLNTHYAYMKYNNYALVFVSAHSWRRRVCLPSLYQSVCDTRQALTVRIEIDCAEKSIEYVEFFCFWVLLRSNRLGWYWQIVTLAISTSFVYLTTNNQADTGTKSVSLDSLNSVLIMIQISFVHTFDQMREVWPNTLMFLFSNTEFMP